MQEQARRDRDLHEPSFEGRRTWPRADRPSWVKVRRRGVRGGGLERLATARQLRVNWLDDPAGEEQPEGHLADSDHHQARLWSLFRPGAA